MRSRLNPRRICPTAIIDHGPLSLIFGASPAVRVARWTAINSNHRIRLARRASTLEPDAAEQDGGLPPQDVFITYRDPPYRSLQLMGQRLTKSRELESASASRGEGGLSQKKIRKKIGVCSLDSGPRRCVLLNNVDAVAAGSQNTMLRTEEETWRQF